MPKTDQASEVTMFYIYVNILSETHFEEEGSHVLCLIVFMDLCFQPGALTKARYTLFETRPIFDPFEDIRFERGLRYSD